MLCGTDFTVSRSPAPLKRPTLSSLSWRIAAVRTKLKTSVSLLGHGSYIRLRWLLAGKRPWQRDRLRIYTRGGGLGDELLSLTILAELKKLNPKCHITFFTRHAVITKNSPDIDELITSKEEMAKTKGWIQLSYEHQIPVKRPIITLMAECLGMDLRVDYLNPPIIKVKQEFRERLERLERPLIVIQPQASKWTPNKDWPIPNWQRLLEKLEESGACHVVEVGVAPAGLKGRAELDAFTSLAGQTGVEEYIHTISQADLFVGPPSSGMHLANSFHVPTVGIFGGYESPISFLYPQMEALYTAVKCAPCWKTTECPFGRECLHRISPEEVYNRILKRLPQLVKPTLVGPNNAIVIPPAPAVQAALAGAPEPA